MSRNASWGNDVNGCRRHLSTYGYGSLPNITITGSVCSCLGSIVDELRGLGFAEVQVERWIVSGSIAAYQSLVSDHFL